MCISRLVPCGECLLRRKHSQEGMYLQQQPTGEAHQIQEGEESFPDLYIQKSHYVSRFNRNLEIISILLFIIYINQSTIQYVDRCGYE